LQSTTQKVIQAVIIFINKVLADQHLLLDDIWVIVHGKVYDLTQFLPEHPGGQRIIMKYAGKDATSAFEPIHPPDIIQRFLAPEVCMGSIDAKALAAIPKVETEQDKQVRLAREKMPRIDEMYNSFDFESKFFFVFSQTSFIQTTYRLHISCCKIGFKTRRLGLLFFWCR
jgi:predicted heme/steroid binding protein